MDNGACSRRPVSVLLRVARFRAILALACGLLLVASCYPSEPCRPPTRTPEWPEKRLPCWHRQTPDAGNPLQRKAFGRFSPADHRAKKNLSKVSTGAARNRLLCCCYETRAGGPALRDENEADGGKQQRDAPLFCLSLAAGCPPLAAVLPRAAFSGLLLAACCLLLGAIPPKPA